MQDNINQTNEHVYFINQLYRDFLLPEILGKDTTTILYWAGKRISRHYNLSSFDDLVDFFTHAEFGKLEKVKERRTSTIFELSGQTVSDRLNSDSKEFSLEAGMIAEALQEESNRTTECEIKILDKEEKVQLTATFN
ncbi:MAG: YslB family protein [Candidatus Lactobacillus pullistercoris]|uniref:YslB family protein n=1 Tax=Candidatus Lactobacillus pullistercoris TaxID=2838636 RepID=A0A9E2NUY5_9LACO|nr:YslB family protein [Candidatus Lactobacillus pullistercoris]